MCHRRRYRRGLRRSWLWGDLWDTVLDLRDPRLARPLDLRQMLLLPQGPHRVTQAQLRLDERRFRLRETEEFARCSDLPSALLKSVFLCPLHGLSFVLKSASHRMQFRIASSGVARVVFAKTSSTAMARVPT